MDGGATYVAIGDFFFVSRERRFVFAADEKEETIDRSIGRSNDS